MIEIELIDKLELIRNLEADIAYIEANSEIDELEKAYTLSVCQNIIKLLKSYKGLKAWIEDSEK